MGAVAPRRAAPDRIFESYRTSSETLATPATVGLSSRNSPTGDYCSRIFGPSGFSGAFRGSLGPILVGHDQFAGYVDWVTGAFGEYTTDILALIEEGNRVSGKMRFHGIHRREMFGVTPSGRHVWWTGMPIFTFDGAKVRDLFVLGDIHGLIERLKGQD